MTPKDISAGEAAALPDDEPPQGSLVTEQQVEAARQLADGVAGVQTNHRERRLILTLQALTGPGTHSPEVLLKAADAALKVLEQAHDTSEPTENRQDELLPRTEAEAHWVVCRALSYFPSVRADMLDIRKSWMDTLETSGRWSNLVMSLDRCEHGRHSIDACLGCPGGQSRGNPHLRPGVVFGYSVHGARIAMPDPSGPEFHKPQAWVRP
jgi:hypothetical protein